MKRISLKLLMIGLGFAMLWVHIASGQYVVLSGLETVIPGYPALAECEVSMDSVTAMAEGANGQPAYTAAVLCNQLVNGVVAQQSLLTYGIPSAHTSLSMAWNYPNTYRLEQLSYLSLTSAGSVNNWVDPLGYDGGYVCNVGPPVYICPDGYPNDPSFQYLQFPTIASAAVEAPDDPIISPSAPSIPVGTQIAFKAFALNSSGLTTSAAAPVTWSISSGTAHGSINSLTGVYTAPTAVSATAQDVIVATGVTNNNEYHAGTAQTIVTVLQPPAPPAHISLGFGAQNACAVSASSVQTIFAGQRINITGCLPPSAPSSSAGIWITTEPNPSVSLGAFVVITSDIPGQTDENNAVETITQVSPTNCSAASYCDFKQFYFTLPGTYTLTFSYQQGPGYSAPTPVSIIYVVSGPKPINPGDLPISTEVGTPLIIRDHTYTNPAGYLFTYPLFAASDLSKNSNGIKVTSNWLTPASNAGILNWVQILDGDEVSELMSPPMISTSIGSGLDNSYPYEYPDNPSPVNGDTPFHRVDIGYEDASTVYEITRNFRARMYLLWTPSPATGCTTKDCVIPIPLGYVRWTYNASALNTIAPVQLQLGVDGWLMEACSVVTVNQVVSSSGTATYPIWTTVIYNE